MVCIVSSVCISKHANVNDSASSTGVDAGIRTFSSNISTCWKRLCTDKVEFSNFRPRFGRSRAHVRVADNKGLSQQRRLLSSIRKPK